jgi:hypothetical protein
MAGIVGFNVILSGASTGTVAKVLSVEVGGQKCEFVDTSDQDNSDDFRTFIPTMLDAGELTAELNYDGTANATANKLNTTFQGKSIETWTITFPDTSSYACSGFITNLGIKVSDTMTGKVTQPVTIKLTAKPTFTDVA